DFSFRLLDLAAAAVPYTIGATVNGATVAANSADVYSLTPAVGQRLFYDGLADSTANMNYQLIAPAGNNVDLSNPYTLDNSFFQMIVPTQAGTYFLVQSNRNPTSATYSFRILDAASSATIAANTPVTDTLTPGTSATLYKF